MMTIIELNQKKEEDAIDESALFMMTMQEGFKRRNYHSKFCLKMYCCNWLSLLVAKISIIKHF